MVLVAAGPFRAGADDEASQPNERPSRQAETGPFWLDRTEVTVGAYRVCVNAGRCGTPARSSSACTYGMGDPELPVNCVTHAAALAFCQFAGKRLPTEDEWEHAARGQDGRPYPWGAERATCAHAVTLAREGNSTTACAGERPARVGSRPRGQSPSGALDMSGNLEEWTAGFYAERAPGGAGPRTGASHTLRGGSWMSPPSRSRTTSRSWGSAVEAGPTVGLRCARSA